MCVNSPGYWCAQLDVRSAPAKPASQQLGGTGATCADRFASAHRGRVPKGWLGRVGTVHFGGVRLTKVAAKSIRWFGSCLQMPTGRTDGAAAADRARGCHKRRGASDGGRQSDPKSVGAKRR